ncbi:MAG: molybdopterin-dependent oxidoreductase, partial [Sporomusaceae bacterium]|nr:molybdopterin-dependent oxidoreductase [Sporomusaceae bacterium]
VILVKPGTDGALALGIMHMLKALGYVNRNFIDKYVLGYDQFSKEILPQYDPENVALITGVSAPIIRKLAEEYGKAQASYIQIGSGMSRYGNGAMTIRTISLLPALTGAWQVRGGGCFNSTSMKQAFAADAITREDFIDKPTRMINMNQLGKALCEEKPPIYSLYVYNCNPAAVCPDQNRVIEGLLREDLFTVVHERFMTDTAKLADVILPATTSAEHSDFYRAYGHHYLQRSYPVIAPLGESKANWDVFCLLAKYMGIDDPFFTQEADTLIDHVWEIPNKLREGLAARVWQEGKALTPNLGENLKLDFRTPSGRIEIYNEQLAEPMPRYISPYGGEGTLHLVIAPSVYTLNSTFTEQQRLRQRRGNMTLLMNEADATARQIQNGDLLEVFNPWGSAQFIAEIRPGKVLAGTVVAEGVWRLADTLSGRSVNALLSPNLTDLGEGSTLSDNCVEIRRLAHDGSSA